MARFSKRKRKFYRKQYCSNNKEKALQLKEEDYKSNASVRLESDRQSYKSNSAPKRRKMRKYNALHTNTIRSAMKNAYASNPALQKEAAK